MKTPTQNFFLMILLSGAAVGCNKQNEKAIKQEDVSIIGIDPCTLSYESGTPKKGYILLLNSTNDTVVTYNLSVAIAKQVDAKLQLKDNFLLSSEAVTNVQLATRPATKEEWVFPLCNAMINVSGYAKYAQKQVIIE